MLKEILARVQQGRQTVAYPKGEPVLPDWFRGRPTVDRSKCVNCGTCGKVCPTGAGGPDGIDLGKCLFCGECASACAKGAIRFSCEYRLAARKRQDLVLTGRETQIADALHREAKRLFGRSLKLRQVSAGGCNACEADTNVLTTVVYDLGRFGIQFVASPRHADGLLITGPVPENMALALKKTYDSVPAPKIVIAVGSCAISGGPYADHAETRNGAANVVPVDLFIPGCPPHPVTILDGLLRFLGRL